MMLPGTIRRRLSLHGDALTRLLGWAVRHVPPPLDPLLLGFWASVFFLVAGKQRRAVVANMRALFPRDGLLRVHARAWRVFWNFANTEVEAVHCLELGAKFDWELEGREHFEQLANAEDGAMILTAHMSNYDVAAFLFAKRLRKPLHTVRAPEATPELQALKEAERERLFAGRLKIHYNTQAEDALGLELLRALRDGEVVAIQGDRLIGSAAMQPASFGGLPCELPAGPFALASAAKCRVFPLFIVRIGRRRYRIDCKPPFTVERNRTPGPGRHPAQDSMDAWGAILADVARRYWFQWYVFEPLFPAGAKWPGDVREPEIVRLPRSVVESAPCRCRTGLFKLKGALEIGRQRRTVPLPPGLERYLSAGRDQRARESAWISLLTALTLGSWGLAAGARLAPDWLDYLILAALPLWLPLLVHGLLLEIYIVAAPLRKLPRFSSPEAVHTLHWSLFSTVIFLASLMLLSTELGHPPVQNSLMGDVGHLLAIVSAYIWSFFAGTSFLAHGYIKLFQNTIRKKEAQLPLNSLPEQLGESAEPVPSAPVDSATRT